MAVQSTATAPSSWVGQPRVKGSTESLRMFLLTFSIIGLQFAWGTELTYCTPYLLSLGMSKSRMSLVWCAGPLSGLIVQPLVGMLSDKSKSRYGRRRPFMLGGAAAVGACYLVLGWAKEIAGWFVEGDDAKRKWAIVLAVVDIYVLDFVINVAQSTCKALIVDTLPIEKQQLGAAWVSRMAGIGHLLVYAVGALDLNSILGNFLGDTQFKKVCVIAAIAMGVAQSVSAWATQERVLVSNGKEGDKDQTLTALLSQTFATIFNIPDRIRYICHVQFWSWIGWFPVLFYSSTWVGELYLRYEAAPHTQDSASALDEVGRRGSMSLIVFSIVATICSIVLPWFIQNPGEDGEKATYTARPPSSLEPVLSKLRLRKPSLLTSWALGCLLFAASMIWAPLVKSVWFATLLVALLGISNALASLAPATFLGVEVNRMSTNFPSSYNHISSRAGSRTGRRSDSIELERRSDSPGILHLRHESTGSVTSSSTGELSGIYLGILNIYTTLPQFVGTAISWVVFSILEPGKSPELAKDAHPDEHHATDGLSGISVCLFIGALSSIVAAFATRKLRSSY